MRILGLIVSLFGLMLLSAILAEAAKSALVERFNENLVVADGIAFFATWIIGAVIWIGWQFAAVRVFVRNHFAPEKLGNPAWERRMTTVFCTLLTAVIAVAFLLALAGRLHG